MDPIIIVSGKWIQKIRYTFNPDQRGCRVIDVNEQTSLSCLVDMILEDYGLDSRRSKIQLSYMFGNKTMKKLSQDTPPVYVCNTRQLQSFLTLSKTDKLRLCVEFTEIDVSEGIKQDNSNDYDDLEAESGVIREEKDTGSFDGEKDEDEDDESDEFDTRFDILDDFDGASSDDDFSLLGKLDADEDSPTLPPKKRSQNVVIEELNTSNVIRDLEMSSLISPSDNATTVKKIWRND